MKSIFTFLKFLNIILALTLLLQFPNDANSQGTSKSEDVKKAIDDVKKSYEQLTKRVCPSLSVLIHTPADNIFAASVSEGIPLITRDTYFRFASNTKNFTSASILNMQEDGWLNIKDKITDLIPGSNISYVPVDPEFNIPYKNEITIEQLLQHSAGVYDIDNDTVPGCNGHSYTDFMTFKNPSHQFEFSELVNAAAANKLSFFPPGKGYHYSNTGYTILSEIIERVYSFRSGVSKKYSDYIRDYITGNTAPVPLDISFPYLATDGTLPQPFVKGNLLAPDSTVIYSNVNLSAHVGEGNGYATFDELDKYVRSMMRGENVLTKSSVELMKNSVSDSNKTYGLGCFYIKDLGYGHNGCIKGYLSLMMYDPETEVSVIVMLPVNDYTLPEEIGIIEGLKTIVNAGFAARLALGYSGKLIPYN